MPPIALLVLGVAAVALIFSYERGSSGTTIVRPGAPSTPQVVGSAPNSLATDPLAPFGAPAPIATGAAASVDSTPKPGAPSPLSAPIDSLSWIFGNAQDALKKGYGQVYRTANGLAVTGPKGAINLLNPGTIHASSQSAAKAGPGSIYQEKGAYYVFGPGFPIKLSASYQPHTASADMSSYGGVTGVVRGWTGQIDRLGNFSAVPAHSVQGSTYQGDAQGDAPTLAEWQSLAGKV